MNATEIRDLNWHDIQAQVTGLRETVYAALLLHGPCTTRQLAEASGISILTVRPRVTELCDLGFALCTGREAKEGVYRAYTRAEAAALHQEREAARHSAEQIPLAL